MLPTWFSPLGAQRPGEKEFHMCHAALARRPIHHYFDANVFFSQPSPWAWGGSMPGDEGFGPGGGFGVRRPLRFLAHKLELDEQQVVQLARILDELKTERAQAAVDD